MKKLTVSIVNYNAGEYLINCLKSLRKASKDLDFDVYVVDNDSKDGSFEKAKKEYKEFSFIKNKKNIGFGAAHNIVLKKANTPYLLTLNPDSEVKEGVLEYMYEFMEKNPDVAVSTCRIEKLDGSLDIASHRGFPTLKASFMYFFLKNDKLYHLTDRDMTKVHDIDSAVGAFMFMRKSVLEKIGYFDEDYFLYAEDIDLCFRAKEAGFRVMYVPDVVITHIKGVSSGIKKESRQISDANINTQNNSINYFYDTMKIFYKKHYAKNYPELVNKTVYFGIDMKKNQALKKRAV